MGPLLPLLPRSSANGASSATAQAWRSVNDILKQFIDSLGTFRVHEAGTGGIEQKGLAFLQSCTADNVIARK